MTNPAERTQKNLRGVHPDLVKVINEALKTTTTPFIVTEGLRTATRQKELVAAGASKTLNSRHLTGHAVDIVPVINGKVCWKTPAFKAPLDAIRAAAKKLKVNVEFGADWRTFKDYPHVQLSRKSHPA
jgi:peptidoglycan L-alanyl-D-glutamate endopeptidase CwlK